MTYKVFIYRDDSVSTVVYENVKHVFMTSDNSVLTIAQHNDAGDHHYIHWPRERFCWFRVDREQKRDEAAAAPGVLIDSMEKYAKHVKEQDIARLAYNYVTAPNEEFKQESFERMKDAVDSWKNCTS